MAFLPLACFHAPGQDCLEQIWGVWVRISSFLSSLYPWEAGSTQSQPWLPHSGFSSLSDPSLESKLQQLPALAAENGNTP